MGGFSIEVPATGFNRASLFDDAGNEVRVYGTDEVDDFLSRYLLIDGSRAMAGDLDLGGFSITNVLQVDGVNVESHAGRHKRGAADEIDGDILGISYIPTNYTRTTSPAEVTDLTELTAHLAGIDAAITGGGRGAPTGAEYLVGALDATLTAERLLGGESGVLTVNYGTPGAATVQVDAGGVGTAKIADEAVTLAKLAHVAQDRVLGRVTAGAGDPEELTAAQVRALINVEDDAAADQVASEVAVTPTGGISSTDVQAALAELDSEKAADLHSHVLADVTDSGGLAALSTVGTAEIDDGAVTLAKLADMATDSLLGRDTAGSGSPEVLSAAAVRGILNVADGAEANVVDSVFGRTGAVVAVSGDYGTNEIDDDSTHGGASLTATLDDIVAALERRVGCWRSGASGASLTTTLTAHALNVEIKNTDGTNHFTWTSGNTSVVAKKAGWYRLWARVIVDAGTSAWHNARSTIAVNGTAQVGSDTRQAIRTSGTSVTMFSEMVVELAADDTVEVQVAQTGGSLSVRGSGGVVLGIERLLGL